MKCGICLKEFENAEISLSDAKRRLKEHSKSCSFDRLPKEKQDQIRESQRSSEKEASERPLAPSQPSLLDSVRADLERLKITDPKDIRTLEQQVIKKHMKGYVVRGFSDAFSRLRRRSSNWKETIVEYKEKMRQKKLDELKKPEEEKKEEFV